MKYRLKKGLPFAKAGEEIICTYLEITYLDKDLYKHTLGYGSEEHGDTKNRLLKEGWIEEIKPREFWVVRRYNIGIVTGFDSESSAVAYIKQTGNSLQYQITKVREVLE